MKMRTKTKAGARSRVREQTPALIPIPIPIPIPTPIPTLKPILTPPTQAMTMRKVTMVAASQNSPQANKLSLHSDPQ